MSVSSFTVSEGHFPKDLKDSITVCVVLLKAIKPYGHCKRQYCLHFVFVFISIVFSKLRNS